MQRCSTVKGEVVCLASNGHVHHFFALVQEIRTTDADRIRGVGGDTRQSWVAGFSVQRYNTYREIVAVD